MPKQNRPVVKDGRLQSSTKKRTDRSYLNAAGAPAEGPDADIVAPEADGAEVEPAAEAVPAAVAAPEPMPMPRPAQVPSAVAPGPASRRKHDVDVDALGKRDTSHALHELRRISIFSVLVIIALVVMAMMLR